jgi:hypothetical protein
MKVYCSALISQNKFPLLRPGRPVQVYSVQLLKASLVLALALALDCGQGAADSLVDQHHERPDEEPEDRQSELGLGLVHYRGECCQAVQAEGVLKVMMIDLVELDLDRTPTPTLYTILSAMFSVIHSYVGLSICCVCSSVPLFIYSSVRLSVHLFLCH